MVAAVEAQTAESKVQIEHDRHSDCNETKRVNKMTRYQAAAPTKTKYRQDQLRSPTLLLRKTKQPPSAGSDLHKDIWTGYKEKLTRQVSTPKI